MLADIGADFVILGHSERRRDHGESDALVQAKADAALAAGLGVIICVGETLEERDAGQAEVWWPQVDHSLPQGEAALKPAGGKLAVAYEPVWAIGTGRVADVEDVIAMHAAVRRAWWMPMASGARPHSLWRLGQCRQCRALLAARGGRRAGGRGQPDGRRVPADRGGRRRRRRLSKFGPLRKGARRLSAPNSFRRNLMSLFIFLTVVQALVAAALVGVILIQKSEGGGLGVGGSPAGFMSARGAADFLTRMTSILAACSWAEHRAGRHGGEHRWQPHARHLAAAHDRSAGRPGPAAAAPGAPAADPSAAAPPRRPIRSVVPPSSNPCKHETRRSRRAGGAPVCFAAFRDACACLHGRACGSPLRLWIARCSASVLLALPPF
jgi:protein translocase SecG subunit